MTTSISELNLMTETEKRYRMYERLEDFHATARNLDGVIVGEQRFDLVLADKWGMLAWQSGAHYQTGGNY